jgi:Regulator of chromosome condensation (RCC1) repeat
VNDLTGVTAIAGGCYHTIALKSDGTVWAWGYNGYGQLGDGTTTDSYTPVQALGPGGSGYLTGVIAIASDGYHTIAMKSDGTVWTWGHNVVGQLGDGTTTDRYTPVQVLGPDGSGYLTGVIAITRGFYHTIALKSDGTGWAWGNNGNGELGDGTVTDRYTPVPVSGLTGVIAVAGGGSHTIALAPPASDTTPPASAINAPTNNAILTGTSYTITGTATDAGSGVQKVEVGITQSGGTTTWYTATGTTSWSYDLALPADGSYTIQSRADGQCGQY